MGNSSVVNIYTFVIRTSPEPNLAKSINIPFPMADLIDRTNKHPHFLSVLGILPKSLREIFKISRKDDFEVALADLSFTLFFYGFAIWEKRQRLSANFWNNACPSNQKIYPKCLKKRKTDKKVISSCKHPFHFLQRHADFSKQRPTRCPFLGCSKCSFSKS